MAKIYFSTLVKYNANTRGTNTGDCTARAISLAFNIDYRQAKQALNKSAAEHNAEKGYNHWNFNSHPNCEKVIKELGGGVIQKPDSKITVGDFADTHEGTYIIWCSRTGTSGRTNHLVCLINDRIYDSWNSSSYYVMGYWPISTGVTQSDITDIQPYIKELLFGNKDVGWYTEYVDKMFSKIVRTNRKLTKLAEKYDFATALSFKVNEVHLVDYTFRLNCTVKVEFLGTDITPKLYEGKITVTFKPTMKQDEIEDYFNTTFYNKFYSVMYGVIDKVEDICEGYELIKNEPSKGNDIRFWDTVEKKSFNSLPYWVRALATSFRIDISRYWGDECREIVLYMKRPSFDTEYNPEKADTIDFRASSMEDLRKGLQYYKDTGDYDAALYISENY